VHFPLLVVVASFYFTSVSCRTLAPLRVNENADRVPGRYMVAFKESVPEHLISSHIQRIRTLTATRTRIQKADGTVEQVAFHEFTHVFRGFAASLSSSEVKQLRKLDEVAYIEQETYGEPSLTQTLYDGGSWYLDRIDQAGYPLDSRYIYNATGDGVTCYMVDTGFNYKNTAIFDSSRSFAGADFGSPPNQGLDCHGHGSAAAGIVGSPIFGVAKRCRLIAVRVFGCGGITSSSAVVAGYDWISRNLVKPAVVSSPCSFPYTQAINDAVQALTNRGVLSVVAAGNGPAGVGGDACLKSPASLPAAFTVAATEKGTNQDVLSGYSNWGKCVDINAPGRLLLAPYWLTSPGDRWVVTGTSVATPVVAGVAAMYLELFPNASPAQVANALLSSAVNTVFAGTAGRPGHPNKMVQIVNSGNIPAPGKSAYQCGSACSPSKCTWGECRAAWNAYPISASPPAPRGQTCGDAVDIKSNDMTGGFTYVGKTYLYFRSWDTYYKLVLTKPTTLRVSTCNPGTIRDVNTMLWMYNFCPTTTTKTPVWASNDDLGPTKCPLSQWFSGFTTVAPAGTFYLLLEGNPLNAVSISIKDESTAPTQFCNPYYPAQFKSKTGVVSDGSGSSTYLPGTSCKFLLNYSGAKSYDIAFSSFALESTHDKLRIYNGNCDDFSKFNAANEWSGSNLPWSGSRTFAASGSKLCVHFYADDTVQGAGWSFNYAART